MATPAQIISLITQTLGAGVISSSIPDGLHPQITVPVEHLLAVAQFVRDNPQIQLDMLRSLSGLDYPDKKQMVVAYDLMSYEHVHELCIKVIVPRDLPELPTVSSIWRAADWHERECYDLFGINFLGHPDTVTEAGPGGGTHPRRILLPDDWVGFPLRKDYQFPREYEGIPGSVEIEWAQKPNYPK